MNTRANEAKMLREEVARLTAELAARKADAETIACLKYQLAARENDVKNINLQLQARQSEVFSLKTQLACRETAVVDLEDKLEAQKAEFGAALLAKEGLGETEIEARLIAKQEAAKEAATLAFCKASHEDYLRRAEYEAKNRRPWTNPFDDGKPLPFNYRTGNRYTPDEMYASMQDDMARERGGRFG